MTLPRIVALSGPVCAGKTTLAKGLAERLDAKVLTTRTLIVQHLRRQAEDLERRELQKAGDELDRERGGAWVGDALGELLSEETGLVVVDAVRNKSQLTTVRALASTFHVHLSANDARLNTRYAERRRSNPELEFPSFEALRANATEASVERLGKCADLLMDTSDSGPINTRDAVLKLLGGPPWTGGSPGGAS